MVIGTAGELPKPPEKPIVFLEGACTQLQDFSSLIIWLLDMDEEELAGAVRPSHSACFPAIQHIVYS